jgi:hypothetical protein
MVLADVHACNIRLATCCAQVQVLGSVPAVGAAGARLRAGLAPGRACWLQRQVTYA